MPLDYTRVVDEVARCQFHSDDAMQGHGQKVVHRFLLLWVLAPFPTCAEHHRARDERNQ